MWLNDAELTRSQTDTDLTVTEFEMCGPNGSHCKRPDSSDGLIHTIAALSLLSPPRPLRTPQALHQYRMPGGEQVVRVGGPMG